jgi:UDP-2,3-diacylglucosamine hydrolase
MIPLLPQKKIYFASDFHLGVDYYQTSQEREAEICAWLDSIRHNAQVIFLVGDIFDFWFEYPKVVPRGYVRFLAKLQEIKALGIDIQFFTGNHDLWMNDYFPTQFGITVHHSPKSIQLGNHKFYIGHGDGLGPGDLGYKVLKKIFTNPLAQWTFRWFHPSLGIALANAWSKSRKTSDRLLDSLSYKGPQYEWLEQYSEEIEKKESHNYYVFGHRHVAIDVALSNQKSRYINLGEWFISGKRTFAEYDGTSLRLKEFKV